MLVFAGCMGFWQWVGSDSGCVLVTGGRARVWVERVRVGVRVLCESRSRVPHALLLCEYDTAFHCKNTRKARASLADTGLVTSIGLGGSLEGEYLCFEICVLLLQSLFLHLSLVQAVSDADIVFELTLESTLGLMELGLQSLTLLDLLLKLVFEIKIRAALD